MALTGRVPLLLLLGLVPVAIAARAAHGAAVVGWPRSSLVGLDLLLALSPRRLVVTREPVAQVRLGAEGATALLLTNPGARRARLEVRDAWQPSAGARGERHTVALPRRRADAASPPRCARPGAATGGPTG